MIQFATVGASEHKYQLEWLRGALKHIRGWSEDNTVSMGWYKSKALKAVVVYHDYAPEYQSICLSAASESKHWLTRETLYHMHHYPFEIAHCRIAVLQVSEHNKNMLNIAKKFGYELTRIHHLRGDAEDEIICVLDHETWARHPATLSYLAQN